MGKKLKTGKSRKDKYYHLAKETGYRSRAAFKLLQLNRKFGFLEKSRVCIDLCAAPGGWLQVASQHMPMSSIIIGLDLVSIKPLHNVTTFQEDITTEKCRQILKKELQTWKADIVLHDGSPNVGQNWLHDAFQQAQLTLQAMKLAIEFLRKGGWFVTKVFRSKDYNALLHVFNQLFKSVHSTKPQASRLESAEIFVVCRGFLAPARVDPALTDPKIVFKEVETIAKPAINLLHPEKRKKTVEGYDDGDYLQHTKLSALEFIRSENFHQLLANSAEIVCDDPRLNNHPKTTPEVRECFKDIKVLGKKELMSLLKWRKEMAKYLKDEDEKSGKNEPNAEAMEVTEEAEEENEEEIVEKQISLIKEEKAKALKRKQKKERKDKRKLQERLNMNMVLPGDHVDLTDDILLFDLNKITSNKQLKTVTDEADINDLVDANDDDKSEDLRASGKRKRVTFDRFGDENEEELAFSSDISSSDDEDESNYKNDDSDEDETENDGNPLIVDMLDSKVNPVKKRTDLWFSKDSFAGIEDDDDEFFDTDDMQTKKSEKSKKKNGTDEKNVTAFDETSKNDADDDDDVDTKNENENSDESSSSDNDSDDSDYNVNDHFRNKAVTEKSNKTKKAKDGFEIVPITRSNHELRIKKLDPMELAIGEELIRSDKRRRELVEMSYNRYTWNTDDNLPDWFVKDEARHYRKQMPVTKEQVQRYKEQQKLIDARPVKKVMEAEARRKRKMMTKLERARKKAETISEAVDVSEREKWKQIKDVYKKAGLTKKKKEEVAYVVARKGATSGRKVRRPSGVQGRFRVVDPRMKKDDKMRKKRSKDKKKKGKK